MKLSEMLREDAGEYQPPGSVVDPKEGLSQRSNCMRLMADFYVLGFLSSGPMQSTSHRQDELDFEVRHATGILLPHLREHLLEMAGNSIASELKHVFDCTTIPDEIRVRREIQYGPYKHEFDGDGWRKGVYQAARANYLCAIGAAKFVDELYQRSRRSSHIDAEHDLAEYHALAKAGARAFRELEWEEAYGGEPWAMGCDTWLSLYGARSPGDVSVYCDKIYSIQHNNGAFLDKNPEYRGEWVEQMLDIKFEAREPEELIRYCSSHMRRLALKVLRTRYGRSWDSDRWGNYRQGRSDLVKHGAIKDKVAKRLGPKFELEHQPSGNILVRNRYGTSLAFIDFKQVTVDNRIKINLYISGHPTYIWSNNIAGVYSAVEMEQEILDARTEWSRKHEGGGHETA